MISPIAGENLSRKLSWTDEEALLLPGVFKEYRVWLSKFGDIVNDPDMITSTTNTVDLTNLNQAETYEVGVTLVTHKYGESAKSMLKKFIIPEDQASTANAISNLENKMVSILYITVAIDELLCLH